MKSKERRLKGDNSLADVAVTPVSLAGLFCFVKRPIFT